MVLSVRSAKFPCLKLGAVLLLFGPVTTQVPAQEDLSRSILSIEDSQPKRISSQRTSDTKKSRERAAVDRYQSAPARLAKTEATAKTTVEHDSNTELVRDRYPSGKVHIERRVALNADGNFVSHGEYREFSEKAEPLVTGSYKRGQRIGTWTRLLTGSESPLLKTYPFNKLRAPFTSTIEFNADQMHGVWVILDRDKQVACQVELQHGQRHGTATFFHPNGQIYLQQSYAQGVLEGPTTEKSEDGKTVREELFVAGRKQVVETEHHSNKSIKSVMRYLSATLQVAQSDSWTTTTLATYTSTGEKVLHGDFVTYHENGQLATKGSYLHGQLNGEFESWYRTGEIAIRGAYERGQQEGEWVWRHANGMKRAVASYNKGQVLGEARSWNDKGKAVTTRPKELSPNSL